MSGDNFDVDRETARRIGAALSRVPALEAAELARLHADGSRLSQRLLAEQAAAMADAAIRRAVEERELPQQCLGPDCLQAGIAHALEILPAWNPARAGLHTYIGRRAVCAALRAHNTDRRRGLRGPTGFPDLVSTADGIDYDEGSSAGPEVGQGRGEAVSLGDTLAYSTCPDGLQAPPIAAEAMLAVEAVGRLPAAQKIAITRLYGLDGLPTASLREIAELLQVGHPEAVNRLVTDALGRLAGDL